jgi:hypothetical protein
LMETPAVRLKLWSVSKDWRRACLDTTLGESRDCSEPTEIGVIS